MSYLPNPEAPSRPERPSSFVDQVYGRILSDIAVGAFPTGGKLPSEKELGERFGVSRPVVRDALSRLQRDGLIESRKGSGSFVRASPPEDLSAAADMAQVARYQRYQEFRLVVEGAAAGLAAERRSETELARIVAAHEQFIAEIERGEFLWQSDRALHLAIAEAAGNEFFAESLEGPEVRLSDFMTVSLKLTSSRSPQRGQLVAREHSNIVDAIRARDSVAAKIAMEYHIVQARRRMLDRTLSP
jgi:GntR family transcriptional repressor for pyruvate dehydrogenase complex